MSRRDQSVSISNLNPVAVAVAAALPASSRTASGWRRTSVIGLGAVLLPALAVAQNAPPQAEDVETVVVSARR